MPRAHLCCRSSVSLLTIHYPNVRPGSPCSSRSRLRSGQTSRLECSLSGWMSQGCIQSTIVVFKNHLFIQKNNVFVSAFYCAANRSFVCVILCVCVCVCVHVCVCVWRKWVKQVGQLVHVFVRVSRVSVHELDNLVQVCSHFFENLQINIRGIEIRDLEILGMGSWT